MPQGTREKLPESFPSSLDQSGDCAAAWPFAAACVLLSFTRVKVAGVHPADLALAVFTLFVAFSILRKKVTIRPLVPAGAALLAGVAGWSLSASPALGAGLADVVKFVTFTAIAAVLFANVALSHGRAIAGAIAAATVFNVLVASVQYLNGTEAPAVCGLLENRTLYGACVALGTPFVLLQWTRDAVPLRAGFVGVAALTLLSAPMLAIFSTAAIVTSALRGRAVLSGVAGVLLLLAIAMQVRVLPRDNAAALVSSVSVFDADGQIRRHAVEAVAAANAIAERPLLGHGPANYQNVVSSGRYRASLPPPAENRVEPGTNPGILVAAVEMGVPTAALLAALLIAAAWGAVRAAVLLKGEQHRLAMAAAVAVCVALFCLLFTWPFISGPGLLVASVIGLALAAKDSGAAQQSAVADAHGQTLPCPWHADAQSWVRPARNFGIAGLVLVVAIVLNASGVMRGSRELYGQLAAADLSGTGARSIVIEAEECAVVVPPMRRATRRDASGEACIGIDEGAGKPPKVEGSSIYPVEVAAHGRYRIWVRAWWSDGCANSVAASFDHQPPALLGNDGTYSAWHWVPGPAVELLPGTHVLTLFHREDNIELDQILLTSDEKFLPHAAMAPTRTAPLREIALNEPARVDAPEKVSSPPAPLPGGEGSAPRVVVDTPPVARVETSVTPQPAARIEPPDELAPPKVAPVVVPPQGRGFLAGIAGRYRNGFECHLVPLGIPYVRLRDEELCDINALKDIDVLMVSDPYCDYPAFYRTMKVYLQNGGTVIMEFVPVRSKQRQDTDGLFYHREPYDRLQNVTLQADDSIYCRGLPPETPYAADVYCVPVPLRPSAPDTKVYGAQLQHGQKRYAALAVRTVGKGRLYNLGVPAAFAAMWRGRKVDPFLVNILRDAIGDRCSYPFANLQYAPQQKETVRASDDFMRSPGQSGGWKMLEGKFVLSGQKRDDEGSFLVSCAGTGFAAIGDDAWKDYRAAVSLRLKSGEAGVWQSCADGARLTLRLKDAGRTAVLTRRLGAEEKILAEAPAGSFAAGWRRLSLFRRNGMTHGYVDGKRVLSVAGAPEASGRCGLCVIDGDAAFDDFSAIDTTALMPDRDVAPDEESGERCMKRYFGRCSEKLAIYAPQWMLEPHSADQNFLRVALPLFRGAEMQLDGGALVPVAAGENLPYVKLDEARGGGPLRDITLHTSAWRDYHFAGRVTDWYASSGEWSQIQRWSCNPEYFWYGGKARQDGVLWHKHATRGPVAMEVLMAPRADESYGQECGRDLNLVVFGNGRDLSEGYLFSIAGPDQGCQLSRNGMVLAKSAVCHMGPPESLHHTWYGVAIHVVGKKIRCYLDRRLVLEAEDEQPLEKGQLGIWTRNNRISIARATLSLSEVEQEPKESSKSEVRSAK